MTSGRILLAVAALCAMALFGCPDDKRQLGDSCITDGECASGLCFGQCLSPSADNDGDGVANEVEIFFGTDPLATDSDGDGRSDTEEYGSALTLDSSPADTDGDDLIDAAEPSNRDDDGDCLNDQLDDDHISRDPSTMALACGAAFAGVCVAGIGEITTTCGVDADGAIVPGEATCDVTTVSAYAAIDDCGNGDEDCDGEVDEDCVTDTCGINSPHNAADVIYVSANGTAPGSGTATDPFTSVATAIDNANGRRILVAKGTYSESLTVPAGVDVVIEGGWEACDFTTQNVAAPATVVVADAEFPALTLAGGTATASMITFEGVGTANALAVDVASGSLSCDRCTLQTSTAGSGHGLRATGGSATLINSVVDLTLGASSGLSSALFLDGVAASLQVASSLVRVSGGATQIYGIDVNDPNAVLQLGNSIVDVRNVTLDGAALRYVGGSIVTAVGNDLGAGQVQPVEGPTGGIPLAVFNSREDPPAGNVMLGCAPAAGSWSLQAASPCKDRGVNVTMAPLNLAHPEISNDREGEPRDAAWDIGPDELPSDPCQPNQMCAPAGDPCIAPSCVSDVCLQTFAPLDGDLDGDGVCDSLDPDVDGDGVDASAGDCDDSNPLVAPGFNEVCGDGVVNDCGAPGAGEAFDPASTFYIAPDGDDTSGDGTASNPWASLERARQAAEALPAATIVAGAGRYPLAAQVTFTSADILVRGGREAGCDWRPTGADSVFEAAGTVVSVAGGKLEIVDAQLKAAGTGIINAVEVINGELELSRCGVVAQSDDQATGVIAVGTSLLTLVDSTVAANGGSKTLAMSVTDETFAVVRKGYLLGGISMGGTSPALDLDDAVVRAPNGDRGLLINGGSAAVVDSAVVTNAGGVGAGPLVAVEVNGGRLVAAHSFIAAYSGGQLLDTTAIRLDGAAPNTCYVVNSIVHAEAGDTDAYARGIELLPTFVGDSHFFNNAIHTSRADQPGTSFYDGVDHSVANWESIGCDQSDDCLTAGGNVETKCDPSLPALRLDPDSPCIAAGASLDVLENTTGLPDLVVAGVDFNGDVRPTTMPDIGPDQVQTCFTDADCDSADDPCTIGAVCAGNQRCGYPNDRDSDFDLLCDVVDTKCPASQVGFTGIVDLDADGCLDALDCNDANPAVFPGAVEDCEDGIDNNCNGGPGLPDIVYVDLNATTDGSGTSDDPRNDLLAAIAQSPGTTQFYVTDGDTPAPDLSALTADIALEGGRNRDCDWEPQGMTDVLTSGAMIGIAIDVPAGVQATLQRFRVELTTPATGDLVGVDITGDGAVVLEDLMVTVPDAPDNADAIRTGFSDLVSVRLLRGELDVGSGAPSRGVFHQGSGDVHIERSTILVNADSAAEATGVFLFGGNHKLLSSRVQVSGLAGLARGVWTQSPLDIANSWVEAAGSPGTGVRATSDAQLKVIGSAIAVTSNGALDQGLELTANGAAPMTLYMANTEVLANDSPAIRVDDTSGLGVDLSLNANAVVGSALIDGLVGGAVLSAMELDACAWPGCINAAGNIDTPCYLDANAQLGDTSPCAAGGVDPALISLNIEGVGEDRDGDARPGPDGWWSIGPDEVDRTCLDADNDGACEDTDCNDADPEMVPGNGTDACLGKDYGCASTGWDTDLTNGIFVAVGGTGTGTALDPFGTLQEAMTKVQNDALAEADIYIGSGTHTTAAILITSTSYPQLKALRFHGGRDPGHCAWAGTGTLSAVLHDLSGGNSLISSHVDMAFHDLELRVEAGAPQGKNPLQVSGGRVTADNVTLFADDAATFSVGAVVSSGELILRNCQVLTGASNAMRGIEVVNEGRLEMHDTTVELASQTGGGFTEYVGIKFDNAGAVAPRDHLINRSVIRLTARIDAGIPGRGLVLGDGANVDILNSVVDLAPVDGAGATALATIAIPGGGDASETVRIVNSTILLDAANLNQTVILANDNGGTNLLQNSLVHGSGGTGQGLMLMDVQAQWAVLHNHLWGNPAFAQNGAQSVDALNTCSYFGCPGSPGAGGNVYGDGSGSCAVPSGGPDYTFASGAGSDCVDAGSSDLSFIPWQLHQPLGTDRLGTSRCAQDGSGELLWDIGATEVACP